MAKGMMDSIATQSLKGLILRKRGKIKQRHQEGWLINKIFRHFVSSLEIGDPVEVSHD